MTTLPPFRHRRPAATGTGTEIGTESAIEPEIESEAGSPPWDDDEPRPTAPSAAPLEDDLGPEEDEAVVDDDAVPVLTQIVEPGPAAGVDRADDGDGVADEDDDDEALVARITAAVLAAAEPAIAAAVRRELARARGEDPD